jgi:porphobilinogen deaminase
MNLFERKIRIGTRGSKLAIAQAMEVKNRLKSIGIDSEIITIKSHGDSDNTPLRLSKNFGIFTKEINSALLDEKIDIAVHSMKDLPTKIEYGLKIAAVLERKYIEDFFISNDNFFTIPSGKKIGTSSPRRRAFVKILRPDIEVVDLRGNVETRIEKFENHLLDGIILALAGIKRLGIDPPGHVLDPDIFVPQANQGVIALVTRDDLEINNKIENINDQGTYELAMIEREILDEMDAGCHSSIGVIARFLNEKILLHVAIVENERMDYWSVFSLDEKKDAFKKFKRWYDER